MTNREVFPSVSVELDAVDLALVAQLQHNGRASLTELGEKLGVSHGTIRNRLDKLLTEKVLKITAVVDPEMVGFPVQVLIGITADLVHMRGIEKWLAEFEEVSFVSTLTGRLDFAIVGSFASSSHLREFLTHKLSKVRGVRRTETFHIIRLVKRPWEWQVLRGPDRVNPRHRELRVGRGAVQGQHS